MTSPLFNKYCITRKKKKNKALYKSQNSSMHQALKVHSFYLL